MKIYKIKFLTLKNCFCHASDKHLLNLPLQSTVRLNTENGETFYFSVGSHTPVLKENELGINSLYAKALNIKEDSNVEITVVENLPVIKTLTISASNFDDYEVLNVLAENVQNTLLNHITVASENQKIIIWVFANSHVVANVDKVEPFSPGCLKNLTEVVVHPPGNDTIHESKSEMAKVNQPSVYDIFRNRVPLDNSEYVFRKYLRDTELSVFRLHPIKDLYKNYNCEEPTEQFFTVFLNRNDLPTMFRNNISKKNPILFYIKILQPPVVVNQTYVDENLFTKDIVVRIQITDEFFDHSFPQLYDFPIMFVPENFFVHFNLKIGSKAILYRHLTPSASVNNIIISTASDHVNTIKDTLKLFLAENCKQGPVLLNSDVILPLKNEIYCSLKFEPSAKNYCLIDSDGLRNIKFSIVEKELEVAKEEVKLNEDKIEICVTGGNFNEIIENISGSLKVTFNSKIHKVEGIILLGKPGSGKTTLLKAIKEKFSKFPLRYHFEAVNCKSLKGKTLDSLSRFFHTKFINLIYYQPSVLLLDDLHIICPKNEEEIQSQESVLINRVSELIRDLFNGYLLRNKIQVIATCELNTEINKKLSSAYGNQLFNQVYKIEELKQNDRVQILQYLFSKRAELFDIDLESYASQMDGYVMQDLVDFVNKVLFESLKEDVSEMPKILTSHCDSAFSKFTSLSLRDVTLHFSGEKDFSDIGGLEDIKKTLIENMLWPAQYHNIFSRAPLRLQSGILLYGPPGTGKTLIAGAAAKQCNLRLIPVKGPELLSKYIGASEQAVRNIFEKAQGIKPCVLFFDEFDSLAPRRGHDSTGVTDRVVNQLLTQLDGIENLTGVCVLAATSRPDLLDPALLRPGRLDKQIFCPFPDEDSRFYILKALSKSLQLSPDVNFSKIASLTEGYSGADLQGVLCSAHLIAIDKITESDKDLQEDCVITQELLLEAVKNSRPSLSKEERLKYDAIYRRFQGGVDILDFLSENQKATLA